jgi:hypothetical protein
MFLGRYQLGEEVAVPLLAVTPPGAIPRDPDLPPAVMVYDGNGAKVLSDLVPPAADRPRAPGLCSYRLSLGTSFGTGLYSVALCYRVFGAAYLRTHTFEVIEGGDPNGAVVSMFPVERPQGRYLVSRTDAGTRTFGRNPGL